MGGADGTGMFSMRLFYHRLKISEFFRIIAINYPYAPIAQLVEQLPFKETVPGSNPGGGTKRGSKNVNAGSPVGCPHDDMEDETEVLADFSWRDLRRKATGKRPWRSSWQRSASWHNASVDPAWCVTSRVLAEPSARSSGLENDLM